MKTGKENRKLLLQSGLIKAKISEYLNSASVPQQNIPGKDQVQKYMP